jgi:hypothetical protein
MSQPNPAPFPLELRHKHQKILHVLGTMKWLNLTPKKFLATFLSNNNAEIKNQQAMRSLPKGWDLSQDNMELISKSVCNSQKGKENWKG